MSEKQVEGQLTLFSVGGVINDQIARVFKPSDIMNSKGEKVGHAWAVGKRKLVRAALGVPNGKDHNPRFERALLEQSDAAFRVVKSQIAGLNGDWTLKKVVNRTMGNGERQISVVIREVIRPQKPKPTAEEIAKLLNKPLEEVQAMLKAAAEAEANQNIDVETTTRHEAPQGELPIDQNTKAGSKDDMPSDEELEKLTEPDNVVKAE